MENISKPVHYTSEIKLSQTFISHNPKDAKRVTSNGREIIRSIMKDYEGSFHSRKVVSYNGSK